MRGGCRAAGPVELALGSLALALPLPRRPGHGAGAARSRLAVSAGATGALHAARGLWRAGKGRSVTWKLGPPASGRGIPCFISRRDGPGDLILPDSSSLGGWKPQARAGVGSVPNARTWCRVLIAS